MEENKKKRVVYFDVMNVLACIAVVALHHNGYVHHFENTFAWKQSLIIECGFYWAVPVFLMISGANLLGYHEKYNTFTYFKKRISRTFVPWLFWSCIVLLWKVKTDQLVLEEKSFLYIENLIIGNKVEGIYWFFTTLFTCYLMIPVLTHLIYNKKVLWYITGTLFVTASVIPALEVWTGLRFHVVRNFNENLIIFVILGYLLNKTEFDKKRRICIYIAGIASTVFRYVYMFIFSIKNQATDTTIKGYAQFHSVFLAVAVFIFLKQVPWEKILPKKLLNFLPRLSSYSFGIYLIHKIVMYYEREILNMDIRCWEWRYLCIPVTYIISVLIVALLKKIPVIKMLTP